MKLISHNKSLYELRNLGNGFVGHVPSAATISEGTPAMRWTGAKIPEAVWKEIVSFFQWSYAETKSETQVRLLLNTDTGEFKAHAFPQKYGTGMTAKELSDNEDYSNQLNAQMSGGNWIKFGTAHHHCSAGAFQSGTDSADETEMGVHITLGNIGGPVHSIHARVSLTIPGSLNSDGSVAASASHAYYQATLIDWFQVPDMPLHLPDSIREDITKYQLCLPIAKEQQQFPPLWAENLIKETPKPIITGFADTQHYPRQVGLHTQSANPYRYNPYSNDDYYEYEKWGANHKAVATEELEEVDLMAAAEKITEIMERENISISHLHGIMALANTGNLNSPIEHGISDEIERILEVAGFTWEEYIEAL